MSKEKIEIKEKNENQEVRPKHQKGKRLTVILIVVITLVIIAGGVGAYFGFVYNKLPGSGKNNTPEFGKTESEGQAETPYYGVLSGTKTSKENSERRPIVVMLGNDPVARPLAGLSKADMVVEMPVLINDITRLMAVYQTQYPTEIGGIRSARHNFIELANGLDALMVHWGGSFRAESYFKLNYIDHVDGLTDGSAFYRVSRKAAPYNGYSNFDKIQTRAQEKGYRTTTTFNAYTFEDEPEEADRGTKGTLEIPYPGNDEVSFKYDPATNDYVRYNNGELQKDEVDGAELHAKNIVVMRTTYGSLLGSQYLDVKVMGSGDCTVYQNGKSKSCTWKKDSSDRHNPLQFYDSENKQIPFVRGTTWIEIVKPSYDITWTPAS
jgi:hypothetical protein